MHAKVVAMAAESRNVKLAGHKGEAVGTKLERAVGTVGVQLVGNVRVKLAGNETLASFHVGKKWVAVASPWVNEDQGKIPFVGRIHWAGILWHRSRAHKGVPSVW